MPHAYAFFGEPIRATGPRAEANPCRFSTKYQDAEADLLYYGYRYYSPSLGRWLSRDPAGERGGINIYAFVWNNPATLEDFLGLGCDVTFDCKRVSETPQGKCDKHCEYVCTEISRIDIPLTPVQCDELPPAPITITHGTPERGNWLCKLTGGRCGRRGKCPLTTEPHRMYVKMGLPERDCSRKACIQACHAAAALIERACDKMPDPVRRRACKLSIEAFRTLCNDGCNAWCWNP